MFQKARESTYLESTGLLVLLIRWRKPLALVSILVVAGAYLFSSPFFITPKFRSTVIFFPSSTNSLSKAIMDDHNSAKQDILAFGAEEESEQMIQILNSDDIRNAITRKYNLLDHYHIPSTEQFPMTMLNDRYHDNIQFSRTEFMSVRIDVLDEDPQVAANIANDIASLFDSVKSSIQGERAKEALAIINNTIAEKETEMQHNEDSMNTLRSLGIMDYNQQSIIWNEQYANSFATYNNETAALSVLEKYGPENDTAIVRTKARIKGAESRMKNLQTKLDLLSKYGGASVALNEQLSMGRQELAKLKVQQEKLKMDAGQQMSHKFTVNRAVKSERKAYPVRWLIVLTSFLLAIITSMAVLMTTERIRELKYKS